MEDALGAGLENALDTELEREWIGHPCEECHGDWIGHWIGDWKLPWGLGSGDWRMEVGDRESYSRVSPNRQRRQF